MIFIVSIPASIILSTEDKAEEWGESSETIQTELTLGNFGRNSANHEATEIDIIIVLNSTVIFIVYILNFFFRNYQRNIVHNIDEKNLTPGDFAILADDLPRDKNKEDIRRWISTIDEDVEVIEINQAFDISEVIYKLRKLDKFNKIKTNFDRYKGKYNYQEICGITDELESEIQTYKDQIGTNENSLPYEGRAIIIFDKQSQAEKMIWRFQTHWILKLLYSMLR